MPRFESGRRLQQNGPITLNYIRLERPGGGIGRRKGLKIPRVQTCAGSSPAPGIPNLEFVFTYNGKPLKSIRTAFENACKRAGIKTLRFHNLRHTFTTRLVLAGQIIKLKKMNKHLSQLI